MTEIEKLVETYLRTDMKAETFMQKRRALILKIDPIRRSLIGLDPDTEESTTVPTESDTDSTSTAAMDAAPVLIFPDVQQKDVRYES